MNIFKRIEALARDRRRQGTKAAAQQSARLIEVTKPAQTGNKARRNLEDMDGSQRRKREMIETHRLL